MAHTNYINSLMMKFASKDNTDQKNIISYIRGNIISTLNVLTSSSAIYIYIYLPFADQILIST